MIGDVEADALRRRHPHNAVHLVLPEGEAPERYAAAARRLGDWLARRVLVEEPEPTVFVYRQRFAIGAERLSRWTLFAALELSPLDAGEVLPHEKTHAAPKEDRLALTLACRAQLSAVFLTARDPGGRLLQALRAAGEASPEPAALQADTPDGVAHTLWRAGREPAGRLAAAAAEGPLLIADGHHRYETALAVRRRLPESESARAALACVASEADPGLRVFPTHRTVTLPPPGGSWFGALAEGFESEPVAPGPARAEAVASRLATSGREGETVRLGLLVPARAEARLLRPRSEALRAAGLAGDEARIASVVFERLVLGSVLGLDAEEAAGRGALSYFRDPGEAARAAGQEGAAFLLPPVRIADVRRVAGDGLRLPPKSTYFAPKIPSGILFRRI